MALWTPAELTTELWLDADDASTFTLDGADVTTWRDKSGNDRHAQQSTGSKKPELISSGLNSKDIVRFTAADSHEFDCDSSSNLGTVSVFYVQNTTDLNYIVLYGTAQQVYYALIAQDTNGGAPHSNFGTPTSYVDGNTPSLTTRDEVYEALKDAPHVVESVGAEIGSGWAAVRIGDYEGIWTLDGDIAEIVILPGTADTATRQLMEGYLAWNWGLEANLPSGHPYESAAPVVGLQNYWDQIYSLLNQSYIDMPYSLLNQSYIDMYYGIQLQTKFVMYYGDMSVLENINNMYYGDSPELRYGCDMPYGSMLGHQLISEQPYAILPTFEAVWHMPYNIADVVHRPFFDMPYDLLVNNSLQVFVDMPYILQDGGTTQQITVSVTIGGEVVNPVHVNVEADLSEDAISAEIHLADESEYAPIARGDAVSIIINTDTYILTVESKRILRPETALTNYSILAVSPVVKLSAPWERPLLQEIAAGTAEAVINTLADSYGPVNYQIVTFPVLEDTLWANDETPLEVIKKITGSAGAVVQSAKDGTINIVAAYPNNIPTWGTVTPDYYLSDASNFISQDETPVHNTGENKYLVGNQLSSDDRLWPDQESVDEENKNVLGFQVPFDATLVPTLEHTGGAWVYDPEYMGTVEETYPAEGDPAEQVEFVAGFSTAKRPIYGALEIEWLFTSLGSITTAEDGRLEAELKSGATNGYSLAAIRYTTKYHLWKVRDNVDETVQFIVRVPE